MKRAFYLVYKASFIFVVIECVALSVGSIVNSQSHKANKVAIVCGNGSISALELLKQKYRQEGKWKA